MKICFFTDDIFTLGGIQRVVSVVASELAQYHDVDILCFTRNEEFKINRNLYNLDEKVNIEVNKVLFDMKFTSKIRSKILRVINEKTEIFNNEKSVELLTSVYYPKEVQDRCIKYLNSKDYDVIIGVAGVYSLLLGIISNKLDAKTVGWQHNSYDAYFNTTHKYHWDQNKLFKAFIKKLDRYIVLTNEDKKLVDNNFLVNSVRIYNPLSFTSIKKSNCEERNIICVGRLVQEQKGLDLLIKAFYKVSLIHKGWILYIVGDGEDKNKLNELIHKFNLEDKIKIKPFTNNIKEYYLNSSILVSSSRWEGFGLVITEAMECGLPVIAFANSGPKEIINKPNENGILVTCGNTDELAKAMIG